MQQKCKFGVGDVVKIAGKGIHERNWVSPDMDGNIGKIGLIVTSDNESEFVVDMLDNTHNWWYHESSLQNANTPPPSIPIATKKGELKVGDNVLVTRSPTSKEVYHQVTWTDRMQKSIGMQGTITYLHYSGQDKEYVTIKFIDNGVTYQDAHPYCTLVKVDPTIGVVDLDDIMPKEEKSSRMPKIESTTPSEFKNGDIVQVTRKPTSDESKHAGVSWNCNKQDKVSETGTIKRVTDKYCVVNFESDGTSESFPKPVLKKLSKWKAKKRLS